MRGSWFREQPTVEAKATGVGSVWESSLFLPAQKNNNNKTPYIFYKSLVEVTGVVSDQPCVPQQGIGRVTDVSSSHGLTSRARLTWTVQLVLEIPGGSRNVRSRPGPPSERQAKRWGPDLRGSSSHWVPRGFFLAAAELGPSHGALSRPMQLPTPLHAI